MTVRELSRDQLDELKERYLTELHEEGVSWGELCEAHEIPDDLIIDRYEGVTFVNDDFFCTAGQSGSMTTTDFLQVLECLVIHLEQKNETPPAADYNAEILPF